MILAKRIGSEGLCMKQHPQRAMSCAFIMTRTLGLKFTNDEDDSNLSLVSTMRWNLKEAGGTSPSYRE